MSHDWVVRVPATSANLGPGFDVLGLALDVHLVVGSRARDGGGRVTTRGEGEGEVATGDDNLVWQSLVRGCDAFDVAVPDLALDVHNAIPLARGMGSSSAAIVAGLALARAVAGVAVGDRDLVALADEIEGHPDNVAPAILGGVVAAARRDDGALAVRRAQPPGGARVLLVVPDEQQLTSAARAALPDELARGDVATQVGRTAFVTGGMVGAWPHDPGVVGDLLHEPARRAGQPLSDEVLAALRAGGVVAWLSGSGPTVAALVDASATTGPTFDGARTIVVDLDLGGVITCPRDGCAWAGTSDCGACPRGRL